MVLATTRYGNYVLVTGTAAEVLQELSDQSVKPSNLIRIAADDASAVYQRGNA